MVSERYSDSPLWDALNECEFDLAIRLLDEEGLFSNDGLWRQKGTRGSALMGLHRFEEAATELATANDLAYRESPDHFLVFGRNEGAALWLMNDRQAAKSKWFQTVEALMNGTKTFSDFSGGVGPCMLLWFAGVTLEDASAVALALKCIKKISKTRRIKSWPGPLAGIALGTRSPEEIFAEYCIEASANLSSTEKAENYLHRRELCQLFFYWGIWCRLRGDEGQCKTRMASSCKQLIWLESEWYLARSEVELAF